MRFRLPDGSLRELGHGDLLGRLPSVALHLDDPRISEAHAMVSLRGEALRLLALRGHLAVGHVPKSDVELVPGARIALAQGLELEVVTVSLPEEVLALEGDGLARIVVAGVSSLQTRPRPALVPGFRGEAAAWIWSVGDSFNLRIAGEGEARPLVPGDDFAVDGRRFRALTVAIAGAGGGATRVEGGVSRPLRILARYDSVHLLRDDDPVAALSGIAARILSELAACRAPVSWETLAHDLWPDERDQGSLRRKWDVAIARLRKKLRDARVRPDLVRADGNGNFELVLDAGDTVVDEI